MMQIIEQTDEEKLAMYMKMPKKKIAEMLIQCNKHLEALRQPAVSGKEALRLALPSDKEIEKAAIDFENEYKYGYQYTNRVSKIKRCFIAGAEFYRKFIGNDR
jgi:hypothetical protein